MSDLFRDEDECAAAAIASLLILSVQKAGRRPRRPRWFEGHEDEVRKRVAAYLRAMRRRALDAVGDDVSDETADLIEAAVVNQQAADALARHLARALGQTALLAVGEGYGVAQEFLAQVTTKAAVPKEYGSTLDQANERAMGWADHHAATLVTQVNKTTKEMIRAGVTAAIESGASAADLAEALGDSLGFSDYRALMIARTELAFANKNGNLEGYIAAGVTKKEWSVSQDEVCDACMDLDGVVLPIDVDFQIMFTPGPKSKAAPRIELVPCPPGHPNCRCDLLPVTEFDYEAPAPPPPPKPAPAPKKPAPAPPPPPPKPEAAPVKPPEPPAPTTPEELHEVIAQQAVEVLGAETHNTGPELNAPGIGFYGALRAWDGKIKMGGAASGGLREALTARAAGHVLTSYAEEKGLAMLVHEEIHGLGPHKLPLPSGYNADVIARYPHAAYYQTELGRVLEEGATELYALHTWRLLAERLGFRLGPNPVASFRRPRGPSDLEWDHAYPTEVTAMEALVNFAAGRHDAQVGLLTPEGLKMLRALHVDVAPQDRVAYLAKVIAAQAPSEAARASIEKAVRSWLELRYEGLVGNSGTNQGALHDKIRQDLDALISAATPEEVWAARRAMQGLAP